MFTKKEEIEISKSSEMEIEKEFCTQLESIKSEEERNVDIKPVTLPGNEIDTGIEIEEEFYVNMESIKSEAEINFDTKPAATLPQKYKVQNIEVCSQYSEVTWQSNNDVSLSLRCRLCAIPNNDMVYIFSSPEAGDILEKIQYSLPIMVRNVSDD